jgi:ribosomal protein S18 acetylase RimI-like enzyme
MNLREAGTRDHPAIDTLVRTAYFEFADRLDAADWEKMRASLAVANLLHLGATLLVAEAEGRIAGSVAYHPPGNSDPNIFPREWASIRALAVDPVARGRGLGRRLTEACIARARTDRAPCIGLHTSEAMNVARGLYERMGFAVDGELPPRFGLRYWRFRKDLA